MAFSLTPPGLLRAVTVTQAPRRPDRQLWGRCSGVWKMRVPGSLVAGLGREGDHGAGRPFPPLGHGACAAPTVAVDLGLLAAAVLAGSLLYDSPFFPLFRAVPFGGSLCAPHTWGCISPGGGVCASCTFTHVSGDSWAPASGLGPSDPGHSSPGCREPLWSTPVSVTESRHSGGTFLRSGTPRRPGASRAPAAWAPEPASPPRGPVPFTGERTASEAHVRACSRLPGPLLLEFLS